MSQTRLVRRFKFDHIYENPTSVVLSDEGGTYGVKRNDNDAVVVADGTAMTNVDTGIYEYVWTDPADDLTYTWACEYVYAGETYRYTGTIPGGTSASQNLFDLVPWIWVYCPGVPEDFLKQQISEVARDFCRRSEVWREWLTVISTVADQRDYTLSTSHDAEFLRVHGVEFLKEDGDQQDRRPWFGQFSVDEEGATLTLRPIPVKADDSLYVRAIFLPSKNASTVADWLIDRWYDAFVAGTIAKVKAMKGTPWYEPGQQQYWEREYKRLRSQAMQEVGAALGPHEQFFQPRRFV